MRRHKLQEQILGTHVEGKVSVRRGLNGPRTCALADGKLHERRTFEVRLEQDGTNPFGADGSVERASQSTASPSQVYNRD
jgi:hypothetical protein